jgi:recombination protein RecA
MATKKTSSREDDLAQAIADDLTKGGFKTYFMGNDVSPAEIKSFLGTGSSLLDLAISNRPNGGIPGGRVTELSGLEGSGKSLVAAHIMKAAQDEGGIAVLLDTENAVNEDFYNAIGLNFNRVIYRQPESIEEIFETILQIIESYLSGNPEKHHKKVVIVVDSVTGSPTRKELEKGFEPSGYGMEKAKFMSTALKQIILTIGKHNIFLVFTNQVRQKINAQPFEDPWQTTGGKALDFYSSVRVRLKIKGKIKNAKKDVVGLQVEAKVVKNRLGPPLKTAQIDLYFDRGIDDMASWVKFLKDEGIVTGGSGGNYKYVADDGSEHKFQSGTWKDFVKNNPDVIKELYQKMSAATIMRYNSEGISTLDDTAVVVGLSDDEPVIED